MLVFFIEENAFPSESVLALSQDAFLGNEARSSQASQSRAELCSARFLHRRKRVSVGKRLGIKPRRFSSETSKRWGGWADGVKVIPNALIMFDLLTPIALAQWISGEGRALPYLTLCTDSFSTADNVKLINILIVKYQLECSL